MHVATSVLSTSVMLNSNFLYGVKFCLNMLLVLVASVIRK